MTIVIDNRVGDWQQSRDPFRTRGPSEVVVFTPQKVLESITEIFIKLCEGNCLNDVGANNRFSEDQLFSVYIFLSQINNGFFLSMGLTQNCARIFFVG